MLYKIAVLLIILYVIYLVFFKKILNKSNTKNDFNNVHLDDEMVPCANCHTFILSDEAIKHKSNYYCSKKCFEAKK